MRIRLLPRRRRRRRPEHPRAAARRKRVFGRLRLLALGLAALAAAAVGVSIGRGGEPAPEPAPEPALMVPLKRLIGQKMIVRMETATDGLERKARRGQIGGVVLFPLPGAQPSAVLKQVDRLQRAARAGGNPPLLVMVDQEGLPVKRFPDGPPGVPPRALTNLGGAEAARLEGRATGTFLKTAGVNVDLAPVLDVPALETSFIFYRAYGQDPALVAELGAGFVRGLLLEGVAATAKHFPGLGRAPFNTDSSFATVEADRALIRADLEPFEAAIKAGVPMVMVSSALYEAFDGQVQAVRSSRVVERELRRRLGFKGAVISDDLEAEAIVSTVTPADASLDAAKAGVDMLLFARTGTPVAQAARRLQRAVRDRDLERSSLVASYQRILELKDRFAIP
jgi:beta-N-acetylhexosaminidase